MQNPPTPAAGSGHPAHTRWAIDILADNTAILSGPQGSGKSKAAPALARSLGCRSVIDPWTHNSCLTAGALHVIHTAAEVRA